MAFKENLKNARLRAGMTLDEVAKAVGTTRQTVQKYESGVIPNVPSDKIEKMADVLDTTPAALMGWDVDSMNLPDNIVPITTMRIPILGDIACGVPAYAQEDFECYAEVGTSVRCDFALRARGDSIVEVDGSSPFNPTKKPLRNQGFFHCLESGGRIRNGKWGQKWGQGAHRAFDATKKDRRGKSPQRS